MSLDDKLAQIDDRLREVDVEISRLTALKRKFTAAKEKLQDKKYLEQRNELAKNDWNQGKIVFTRCCLLTSGRIIHFRNLSMVKDCETEAYRCFWTEPVSKSTT